MNKSVWLTRLLSVGSVLETVIGLVLLIYPSGLASILLRSPLEVSGVIIGRIAGGALLALGIACWRARKTPSAPASLGISWAFLAYNVVACVTLAWAGSALGSDGLPALSASVLHGTLGAVLLWALLGRGQA